MKYLVTTLTLKISDREISTLHWTTMEDHQDPVDTIKRLALMEYYGELDEDETLDDFDDGVDCFDFFVEWDNSYTICNSKEELASEILKRSKVDLT